MPEQMPISATLGTPSGSSLRTRFTPLRYLIEAVFLDSRKETFLPGLFLTEGENHEDPSRRLWLTNDMSRAHLFFDFGVAHSINGELRSRGWPTRVRAIDTNEIPAVKS